MTEPHDDWDALAATFDDEPDHGLRDPHVRAAWRALLAEHLPSSPSEVVDLGCGTGTLSVLLAELGHRVRCLDSAPAMVAAARAKVEDAGLDDRVEVGVGDAAAPAYADGSCDVVLSRHVLWALADPSEALARWVRLLRPGGRLLLVEGRWHTGGGITGADCERLVRAHASDVTVRVLDDAVLWGGPTTDERYLLEARVR